jgi:hypothetical protein
MRWARPLHGLIGFAHRLTRISKNGVFTGEPALPDSHELSCPLGAKSGVCSGIDSPNLRIYRVFSRSG